MFARVGGDEFLVFMAVKDEGSGRSVAERLHAAMNAIPSAGGQHLKCSVGTVVVPPGRLSIDELVRRADNLMYQAKQRGACHELAVASDVGTAQAPGRARSLSRGPAIPALPERKRGPERRSAGRASR